MPEANKEVDYWKFLHLNKVSTALGIQPDKLYNNFHGKYDSLGKDKDRIARFMMPHITRFFSKLGWGVVFKKGA